MIPVGVESTDTPGTFTASPKFRLSVKLKDAEVVSDGAALTQLVLKMLYTRIGSVYSNPKEGTGLGSLAGTGNVSNLAAASSLLEDSISRVEDQVKAYQSLSARYTPAETLDSITIKSISVGSSSVTASILIRNTLGEVVLLKVGT